MDRRAATAFAGLAAAGAVGGMWAVSTGRIPDPAVDEPVWYVLVAFGVGYWLAVVAWARAE
jgi:hypothetical protein